MHHTEDPSYAQLFSSISREIENRYPVIAGELIELPLETAVVLLRASIRVGTPNPDGTTTRNRTAEAVVKSLAIALDLEIEESTEETAFMLSRDESIRWATVCVGVNAAEMDTEEPTDAILAACLTMRPISV